MTTKYKYIICKYCNYIKLHKAHGLCRKCYMWLYHLKTYEENKVAINERNMAYTARMKAEGRCIKCGGDLEVGSNSRCLRCREIHANELFYGVAKTTNEMRLGI